MTTREEDFILAYTDKTSQKTYKNALQSAIKANYSVKGAKKQGHRLIKKPTIANRIEQIEKAELEKYAINKDKAIEEARRNFELSAGHNERKYWYDMWVNLQGWLIQKIESKNETTTIQKDEEKEEIQRLIRQYTPVN
jgi:hypothetical protein